MTKYEALLKLVTSLSRRLKRNYQITEYTRIDLRLVY